MSRCYLKTVTLDDTQWHPVKVIPNDGDTTNPMSHPTCPPTVPSPPPCTPPRHLFNEDGTALQLCHHGRGDSLGQSWTARVTATPGSRSCRTLMGLSR